MWIPNQLSEQDQFRYTHEDCVIFAFRRELSSRAQFVGRHAGTGWKLPGLIAAGRNLDVGPSDINYPPFIRSPLSIVVDLCLCLLRSLGNDCIDAAAARQSENVAASCPIGRNVSSRIDRMSSAPDMTASCFVPRTHPRQT